MKQKFVMGWVVVGCALGLGACGPMDDGGGDPADDVASEVTGAVTDPVPGMTVREWPPRADGSLHYTGECETSWKDGDHSVQSLCQIQQFYNGAWHADSAGWFEENEVGNGSITLPRRWCVGGVTYTLRTASKGRVLFAGGWSAPETAISAATNVTCPR